MGSDDLFHKRKAKLKENTSRHKASRMPYQKVLIVTEGTKTEPIYFKEVIDYYEINTANVRISGECGSDPISVFNFAVELYHQETIKDDPFDRVYCVFDQDSYHLGTNKYKQALDKIGSIKPKETFFAITSVPSFEYWFILHFTHTTAQFFPTTTKSVGDAVLNKLLDLWPEYTKSMSGTFLKLLPDLEYAKSNASRSLDAANATYTDNPTTHVHELVEFLQNIKDLDK